MQLLTTELQDDEVRAATATCRSYSTRLCFVGLVEIKGIQNCRKISDTKMKNNLGGFENHSTI